MRVDMIHPSTFGSTEEQLCVNAVCAYLNMTTCDVQNVSFAYDTERSVASVMIDVPNAHVELHDIHTDAILATMHVEGLTRAKSVALESPGESSSSEKHGTHFVLKLCAVIGAVFIAIGICYCIDKAISRAYSTNQSAELRKKQLLRIESRRLEKQSKSDDQVYLEL